MADEHESVMAMCSPMVWGFFLALAFVVLSLAVNVPHDAEPDFMNRGGGLRDVASGPFSWIGGLVVGVVAHFIGGALARERVGQSRLDEERKAHLRKSLKLLWGGLLVALVVVWIAGPTAVDIS